MTLMYTACKTDKFLTEVRPYIRGWKGNLKDGVKYQGLPFEEQDRCKLLPGPSGAESSILPTLDAFVGLRMRERGCPGCGPLKGIMEEFRNHIPAEHVAFIRHLERQTVNAKSYVEQWPKLDEQRTMLMTAY